MLTSVPRRNSDCKKRRWFDLETTYTKPLSNPLFLSTNKTRQWVISQTQNNIAGGTESGEKEKNNNCKIRIWSFQCDEMNEREDVSEKRLTDLGSSKPLNVFDSQQ